MEETGRRAGHTNHHFFFFLQTNCIFSAGRLTVSEGIMWSWLDSTIGLTSTKSAPDKWLEEELCVSLFDWHGLNLQALELLTWGRKRDNRTLLALTPAGRKGTGTMRGGGGGGLLQIWTVDSLFWHHNYCAKLGIRLTGNSWVCKYPPSCLKLFLSECQIINPVSWNLILSFILSAVC